MQKVATIDAIIIAPLMWPSRTLAYLCWFECV